MDVQERVKTISTLACFMIGADIAADAQREQAAKARDGYTAKLAGALDVETFASITRDAAIVRDNYLATKQQSA
jgi:hypothetical protein